MAAPADSVHRDAVGSLSAEYARVRGQSEALTRTLAPEDTVVQSMPDVSPTKWHLAHVTWFFERFVLEAFVPGYERLDERYDFLFNSYYYTAGQMHARPRRGLLSRPTLAQVFDYRAHVDGHMRRLLEARGDEPELAAVVRLGLNHEQQHQELLLTDIKHVLSQNPLQPAYDPELPVPPSGRVDAYAYRKGASGIHRAGAEATAFTSTTRRRATMCCCTSTASARGS